MKRRFLSWLLLSALLMTGCSSRLLPQSTDPSAVNADTDDSIGVFKLDFITIGKGDAFLLSTPQGQHYLMDTGKAQDYPQIARFLRVQGIAKLDGIFLSHGHKDHAGGLAPIMEAFPTTSVYLSGKDSVSYTEIDARTITSEMGGTLCELSGGETLDLGGVTAQIWIPAQPDFSNENNNSMILRLTHGTNTFLLMGDAELEEEALLMDSGFPLQSDVLKLGHHGETDATSYEFLRKVSPSIGLIPGNKTENPDSVNPLISGYLKKEHVSFYYSEGDTLEIASDGTHLDLRRIPDGELPSNLTLHFSLVDRENQSVTIRNDGSTQADLAGCTLISQRGDEVYLFPDQTLLDPGAEITVVCQDSSHTGQLIWNQNSVWKKKGDTALLYDKNMNLLDKDPA